RHLGHGQKAVEHDEGQTGISSTSFGCISPAFDVATQAARMRGGDPYEMMFHDRHQRSSDESFVAWSSSAYGISHDASPNAGKRAKTKTDQSCRSSIKTACRESSRVADGNDAKSINNENVTSEKHPTDYSRIPGKAGFGVGG
ncbi:hypothetical protein CCMA1212_001435, partial [Trichoderma ghanense]